MIPLLTLPDIERIFKDHVIEPETQYKEKGSGFIIFRDPQTEKLFKISVVEQKPRQKRQKKKIHYNNGII
jgi:hypothetical protein